MNTVFFLSVKIRFFSVDARETIYISPKRLPRTLCQTPNRYEGSSLTISEKCKRGSSGSTQLGFSKPTAVAALCSCYFFLPERSLCGSGSPVRAYTPTISRAQQSANQSVINHTIIRRRAPPFSFLTSLSLNTHPTRQSTSSKSHHASSYRRNGMPRYRCRPLQRLRLRPVDRARNIRTDTAIHLCVQGGRRRWRQWENGTANAAIW